MYLKMLRLTQISNPFQIPKNPFFKFVSLFWSNHFLYRVKPLKKKTKNKKALKYLMNLFCWFGDSRSNGWKKIPAERMLSDYS